MRNNNFIHSFLEIESLSVHRICMMDGFQLLKKSRTGIMIIMGLDLRANG